MLNFISGLSRVWRRRNHIFHKQSQIWRGVERRGHSLRIYLFIYEQYLKSQCHPKCFARRGTFFTYEKCAIFLIVVKSDLYLLPSLPLGGGGIGGSRPPASRTLQSRLPPLFSWLPPFCPFSIAKYYAMLRNFPLFLPLPALLELPPPTLSSPSSCTPPAPILPGSRPSVPPPPPLAIRKH